MLQMEFKFLHITNMLLLKICNNSLKFSFEMLEKKFPTWKIWYTV